LMLVLDYVVHRTSLGMAMRAISWDRTYVPLMGIPVNLIISITFAVGAGLAGAAGTMYGLAYPVIDPYMGILVGWKAFIAAVVGGIGNVRGAMLGAFILGGVEIMVVALLPSTYRDLIVFSLLLGLIILRPHGLLGQPRVQKV
jgi:branched-chain amino acid transport system permease protein